MAMCKLPVQSQTRARKTRPPSSGKPGSRLKSAFAVGDRLALLYGGRIVFSGTPEEARQSRDPRMRQFLEGTSEGPIQPV